MEKERGPAENTEIVTQPSALDPADRALSWVPGNFPSPSVLMESRGNVKHVLLALTCNPSTREARVGGSGVKASLGSSRQPKLHKEALFKKKKSQKELSKCALG